MNTVLVRRVLRLLPQPGGELPAGVTCGRLARLVEEILGDTIERYPDGRMLIWGIARHDGYNIPEYPMAECGDVREFLKEIYHLYLILSYPPAYGRLYYLPVKSTSLESPKIRVREKGVV